MFNLSTPLTVSLVGGVLFLVFVVVAALRFKRGKLPIVSATLSLLALAAAILGLFFHAGQSDQAPVRMYSHPHIQGGLVSRQVSRQSCIKESLEVITVPEFNPVGIPS